LENDSGGRDTNWFRSTVLGSKPVLKLVVNLPRVFFVTKNRTNTADRIIASLVFGLECPSCHASEGGGGSDFDETLKVVNSEKQVLSFNSSDGRSELVDKEFYEDDIGELLVLFSRAPILFVPLVKDLVATRRGGMVVKNLSIFLRDLKWFGDQVWDIASNQHIWIEVKWFDLVPQVYEDMRMYRSPLKNQTLKGITPAHK
jgi:hypothetical protein